MKKFGAGVTNLQSFERVKPEGPCITCGTENLRMNGLFRGKKLCLSCYRFYQRTSFAYIRGKDKPTCKRESKLSFRMYYHGAVYTVVMKQDFCNIKFKLVNMFICHLGMYIKFCLC